MTTSTLNEKAEKMKESIKNTAEKSKETIREIIGTNTMFINEALDSKLIDIIKDTNNSTPEKLLNLIQENFESSRQLSVTNTKEILDAYNKHTNLAVNFNQKIGENINTHIEYLFSLQSKGMNKFSELASEWWKQTEKAVKY